MKRIAIFCDGTWNKPDELVKGMPCPTNVAKMADALALNSEDGTFQLLYYDTGVGSEGSWMRRILEGMTGTGILKNIRQAYQFIVKNYEQGDELFFFGFSRGAFTVRSLAGLIRNSGILKKENSDQIRKAFDLYRSRKKKDHPNGREATLFRKTFAVENITKIKFIGVWDTVGELGNPLFLNGIVSKRNQFHDYDLSSHVNYAFQALAIDEKRKSFQDALWYQQADSKNQILEQVWFAGAHSDVGGGYLEHELSDVPLKWLLEKAQKYQLSFGTVEMNLNPIGKMHKSYKSFYMVFRKWSRKIGVVDSENGKTYETIHPSVLERYNNDKTYRPKNLVDYFKRNP